MTKHRLTGDYALLVKRYAEALYAAAENQDKRNLVAEELRGLKGMARDIPEFYTLIRDKRLSHKQRLTVTQQIIKCVTPSRLVANFLTVLAQNTRLELLGDISAVFEELLSTARGEFTADVCTAQSLSVEQEKELASVLQKIIGGQVRLNITKMPELLGGFVVKFGSHQIDASLRGKLARLERQLKAQGEAA